jgi:hypothetical protein
MTKKWQSRRNLSNSFISSAEPNGSFKALLERVCLLEREERDGLSRHSVGGEE